MQITGFCCDSFSIIIRQTRGHDLDEEPLPVSLCRINFSTVLQMLRELQPLSSARDIRRCDLANAQKLLWDLLRSIVPHCSEHFQTENVDDALHFLSLATQFLSLGLLSYSQGHVGPIQPFFLDTPQQKIVLTGSKASGNQSGCITAELTNLTCIGDMVGDQVLTFKVNLSSTDVFLLETEEIHDVLACPEDLIDTWGPANFIVPHASIDSFPCAIKICGGVIYAPVENALKFHWKKEVSAQEIHPVCFNSRTKICIGSAVVVNLNCNINEEECWSKSSCALETLGVHGDYWRHDERQLAGQLGCDYAVLQASVTKHKIPGETMKQSILRQDAEMLKPYLNYMWGLQVSFCTGVARRVPLRELIADLLPTFAMTFTLEYTLWNTLRNQHHVLDAMRQDSVLDWFDRLPADLYSYLLKVIGRILRVLQSTGIDAEKKFLSVAWPFESHLSHCLRISCEKANSWTRLLSDSEDCATFAYISTKCLVTTDVQCGGASSAWRNSTPLLGTAVVVHNENPSNPTGPLESKGRYFFKKPDSLLLVSVERQLGSSALTLFVSPSSMPARLKQRVWSMEMLKKQRTRIRERQRLSETAEHVAVIAKYEGAPVLGRLTTP
jgi:hypothetical protein